MLNIHNLSVAFGGEYLFEEISFRLNGGDRVGLIGKNGAGKSTMLKLLSKEMSLDEGAIATEKNIKIGFLKQDIDFEELQEFKNVSYPLPACFITGTLDPVNFFARDESASEEDILKAFTKNYDDLRKVEILDGIGHWTQQENPEAVTAHMIDFLKNI